MSQCHRLEVKPLQPLFDSLPRYPIVYEYCYHRLVQPTKEHCGRSENLKLPSKLRI